MNLLLALLRVALGVQDGLDTPLSRDEWHMALEEARKQAILGLVWCAIQRLPREAQPCLEDRLDWMHYASKIVQHNERLERLYGSLTAELAADGIHACIFKGQTLTKTWPEPLRPFRQCGDIDVWTTCGYPATIAWARVREKDVRITPKHVSIHIGADKAFDSAIAEKELRSEEEVELHFSPASLAAGEASPMWQFCEAHIADWQYDEVGQYFYPTVAFDRVYLLHHAFRHFLRIGIGIRHIVDLYFLCRVPMTMEEREELGQMMDRLRIRQFASGVMWVLHTQLGLERASLWCRPDEKEGRMLLEQVMRTGNFGDKARSVWLVPIKIACRYPREVVALLPQKIRSLIWMRGK